jgi:aminopeptidase YwaD
MTEEEGKKLIPHFGKEATLNSKSERIPGTGYNVIGKKGKDGSGRIVVSAHIDSKKGTPGALDNATGVTVMLLLAELLKDYSGERQIELVAFNGEDYFSVPGQMKYVEANQDKFGTIILNINIDGAGYKEGKSAFSFFDLPDDMHTKALDVMKEYPGILEGAPWPQGDHGIFIQYGRPAIAVSSQWFAENISNQTITHTPKDTIDIVDCHKIAEIALGLNRLIREI